jgi:hypothetical protein
MGLACWFEDVSERVLLLPWCAGNWPADYVQTVFSGDGSE